MFCRGSKFGVGLWYVLWGAEGGDCYASIYLTLHGLAKWINNHPQVSIHRIGRLVLQPDGPEEKESWTRPEFVEWAENLVPFKIK